GVDVRYAFVDGAVIVSAYLPSDWRIEIHVDGDQNGIWGGGPLSAQTVNTPTSDLSFGVTSSGQPCSTYILASEVADPGLVQQSSYCGQLKSAGATAVTPPDSRG